MTRPTVRVDVEWRRRLGAGESGDLLIAEAMSEACRRARLVADASGGDLGILLSWDLVRCELISRAPYPVPDAVLRVDGFPGGVGLASGADGDSGADCEAWVVLRGTWELAQAAQAP